MDEASPSKLPPQIARSGFAVRGHILRNRICMPAHSYGFTNDTAGVKAAAAYVGRRLRSGVAMIVIGEAEVPFGAPAARGQAPSRLAGDASIELYRAIAGMTAAHGGIVLEQLYHPGGQVWYEEQRQAVAPSSVPQAISYTLPRTLSVREIEDLTANFADAARVAVQNGLQGVELKADQGKLHHQFLSRRYNRRDDAYGGDVEGRARFLIECLKAIRISIGTKSVLGLRLPGPITAPEGGTSEAWSADISAEEYVAIAKIVEAAGLADYLSISGETNSTAWGYARNHGDGAVEPMTFRNVASMLRREVRLPLLLTGKILTLDHAEELLAADECDLVGMVRALIADGDMLEAAWQSTPNKRVRPCISCNIACVGRTWIGQSVRCALDPTSGRESEIRYRSARKTKIAIAGGGPAGLVFAAAASEMGSSVDLFESELELGGQLKAWSLLPDRGNILTAVDYWKDVLRAQGVSVALGAPAPSLTELGQNYDYLVDATGGAVPVWPEHAAVRQLEVTAALVEGQDWHDVNVIVFDANRHIDASGVALRLQALGASVRVLSPFEYVGIGIDPVTHSNRLGALRATGISTSALCDVAVGPNGIEVLDHSRNKVKLDTTTSCIVWCVNRLSDDNEDRCGDESSGPKVIRIGEKAGALGLENVVRQAFDSAHSLLCDNEE